MSITFARNAAVETPSSIAFLYWAWLSTDRFQMNFHNLPNTPSISQWWVWPTIRRLNITLLQSRLLIINSQIRRTTFAVFSDPPSIWIYIVSGKCTFVIIIKYTNKINNTFKNMYIITCNCICSNKIKHHYY